MFQLFKESNFFKGAELPTVEEAGSGRYIAGLSRFKWDSDGREELAVQDYALDSMARSVGKTPNMFGNR